MTRDALPGDLLTGLWVAADAPRLGGRQWEALLGQARATRLTARLARRVQAEGWAGAVPVAPARHLDSGRRLAERLHHEVRWEIERVRAALAGLPTPVVLLKGAAYVGADLPPARGRLFSDIDIMVRRDQLAAVESALMAAGWIAEKLSPYDDRYYREYMHELPPLQHVQRRTFLDVHHTIAPPTSRFAVDGERLLAACEALPHAPGLSVLAPPDMVLHSAVHLFQEGEFHFGLRDLLDLNDLLLHFGARPGFWAALLTRARELGAEGPLHHALTHVERLFGTRAPAELADQVAALAPPALRRQLMALLLAAALRPQHPSCDSRFAASARWLLYVRSHWLRMPWYQIAPHLLRKAWMRALERRKTPDAAAPALKAEEPALRQPEATPAPPPGRA